MRATGDLGGRQLRLLTSPVLETLCPRASITRSSAVRRFIDRGGSRGVALLMRDVSAAMIPPGSEPIEMHQHRGFIDDMATMHATYWGFRDDAGLCPLSHRYVDADPDDGRARGGDASR